MKIRANYIDVSCDQYVACHMLVMLFETNVVSDHLRIEVKDIVSNDVGMAPLIMYPAIDDEAQTYTVRMILRGVEEIKVYKYEMLNKMLNNRLIPFWMTEIDKCVASMKGLN